MQTLPVYSKQLTNRELLLKLRHNYPKQSLNGILLINIQQQRLYHINDQTLLNTFVISSADKGTGNTENSGQTPLGAHFIKEKFGDGAPLGTQFKARQSTNFIPPILSGSEETSEDDYITSRILWLSGLEVGYNLGKGIDSYKRYIYIHGTDEEGRLGSPASHGCIRMANQDIIDLYSKVSTDTLVYLYEQ
jgi:hypothetical protein